MKLLLTIIILSAGAFVASSHEMNNYTAETSEVAIEKQTDTEVLTAPTVSLFAMNFYEGTCTLEGSISSPPSEVIDYGFIVTTNMGRNRERISVLHKDSYAAGEIFETTANDISFSQLSNGNKFSMTIKLPYDYLKRISVTAYAVSRDKKEGISQTQKGIELTGPKEKTSF